MSNSRIAVSFSLLFSLLLSLSWATSNHTSSHHAFIQCLENKSDSSISAVLYTQSNSSYSSVLQNYIRNLRFNESYTPQPKIIITAKQVSHIQSAILCAKAHGMQMKIRSGGHDFEGVSYWSDDPNFFVLDMFNFRSIDVSVEDESAWVEVGATLGEVYYRISEKSRTHGFPAGVCPTVGVGGHFSAGGYGNMMRKYGLSVDNIIDAKIIDVNGRLLDRKEMGEDLFWAITGGGGSSYGVVLSYEIKIVPVPENVTVFRVTRTNYDDKFIDLVHRYQQVAADEFPRELFLRLILDVVNETNRATFVAMFLGNSRELVALVNSSFPEMGLLLSDCLEISWAQSVLFWTDFPTGTPVTELLSRVPQVLTHLKRKSDYLKKPIPKQALELLFKKMVELQRPLLTFNPYGGRMAEIPAAEKPFPHRSGNIAKLQYAANWDEDGAEAASRYLNLTRELYAFMTPYVSTAPRQAFLAYRDLDIGINHNGRNSYSEGLVYGLSYGGRMVEKPFPHGAGNVAKLQCATNWEEDGEEAANRYVNLTRQLFDYMTQYVSAAPREAFLNYRDLDVGINENGGGSYAQGKVYGLKYFKENFYRLVKIKTNVDPHNFFRNEQSIPVLPLTKMDNDCFVLFNNKS